MIISSSRVKATNLKFVSGRVTKDVGSSARRGRRVASMYRVKDDDSAVDERIWADQSRD